MNNQIYSQSDLIFAPISVGELIDKITILQIKRENMTDEKLLNINQELKYLETIEKKLNKKMNNDLFNNLKTINKNLWDIEEKLRTKERKNEFDKEFIHLARSAYKENDKRAFVKSKLNSIYNSKIIEEKSYN